MLSNNTPEWVAVLKIDGSAGLDRNLDGMLYIEDNTGRFTNVHGKYADYES